MFRYWKNLLTTSRNTRHEWRTPFPIYLKRWIESDRSPFHLLGVQAFIVGILTGLLWVLFSEACDRLAGARARIVSMTDLLPLQIVLAVLISGGMVALAMAIARQHAPETLGGGIAFMEGVLDGVIRLRPKRVLPVKGIGSLLILASGMTLGPEGPIVQMAGAIGTAIARIGAASEEHQKILASAGVGAAMAGAFNAPLGGILVVIEEFRPEFENRIIAWHAVTLSVVGSTLVTRWFLGSAPVFSITRFPTPPLESLWIFAILGILLGTIACGFNRLFFWFSDRLGPIAGSAWVMGALIGILTVIAPVVTGDGLDVVIQAFNNHQPGWVILLIFATRFLLTLLCGATGASGGLYAPMLALATLFSLGFAREMHTWLPGFLPQPAVLAIAGMAALVSASTRTPLAVLVITVEMTDNYELILAMIVCSLSALMTAQKLGGQPLYSVLLHRSLHRQP
jgi:chloride channel protein, CIC family